MACQVVRGAIRRGCAACCKCLRFLSYNMYFLFLLGVFLLLLCTWLWFKFSCFARVLRVPLCACVGGSSASGGPSRGGEMARARAEGRRFAVFAQRARRNAPELGLPPRPRASRALPRGGRAPRAVAGATAGVVAYAAAAERGRVEPLPPRYGLRRARGVRV
jgi:hypothetical protein